MAEQENQKSTGGGPGAKAGVPAAKPKAPATQADNKHLVYAIFPELVMPEVKEEVEYVTGPNGKQMKKIMTRQKMLRWAQHRLRVTTAQLNYLRTVDGYGRDFFAAGEIKVKLNSPNRGERKFAEAKLGEIVNRSVLGGLKPPLSLGELITEVLKVPDLAPVPVEEVPV